ncbi:response regulator [Pseudocnuella soli]|uniref:response regulator n=1 Tax=Pseudocnuella soli TaxID=2502779 RepID=UPI001404A0B6|nr:response regulator [Pseudocnuella soli]
MNPPKYVVLYADDDADDLSLVQEAFNRYSDNVELVTATDGLEALSYLNSLGNFDPVPCLVILDINMPRMNGKEALKKIRDLDRFSRIPVVLFSTSSMPHDRDYARQYGAGFITKPLDVRQIEAIAEEFVSHCAEDIKKGIRRQTS